ncbi:unnamed protein product, partial [Mesorhabditis spiculigera]
MSVILCAGAAIFEVLLAIFVVLTYLGIYLCLKRVATPHKMTMKERYQLHSSDLFYAWEDPMRCLGLYGRSHFFLILVTLFLQINSYLSSSDFFLDQLHRVGPDLPLHYRKIVTVATPLLFWMFYIGRTFCCFSMLGMPVLIGGQIHALKTQPRMQKRRSSLSEVAEQHFDKNTIILAVNLIILMVLMGLLYMVATSAMAARGRDEM